MRVTVLGTGIMGAPIARNLAKAGHEVTAWNRSRDKAEPLAGDGVKVAGDPAEAVRGAQAVVTMLTDGAAVREVMSGGPLDAIADAVWLQVSTVGTAATEHLAGLARDAGVPFVDCPVLGTKQPAEDAQLVVLASGPEEARPVADEVFDAIAQKIVWLGEDAGAGTRMKLVLNNWVLGLVEVLGESIALARELGIEPGAVLEVLDGSAMGSPYALTKGKLMAEEHFEPSFPLRLAAKDSRLVLEAGDGLELAAARATAAQMERGVEMGHGDEDLSVVYRVVRATRE